MAGDPTEWAAIDIMRITPPASAITPLPRHRTTSSTTSLLLVVVVVVYYMPVRWCWWCCMVGRVEQNDNGWMIMTRTKGHRQHHDLVSRTYDYYYYNEQSVQAMCSIKEYDNKIFLPFPQRHSTGPINSNATSGSGILIDRHKPTVLFNLLHTSNLIQQFQSV